MTADPPRLKFVNAIGDGKTKGRRWYYFRSKETGNIKLGQDPASAAFMQAYANALKLRERLRQGVTAADPDSFGALINGYLKSVEFKALADSTQLDYSRLCDLLTSELGDAPFRYATRAMIKAVRDDFADTVRKANKVVAMLSILYSWAAQEEKVPDGFNPAAGLKKLKRKDGAKEYVPWSDAEVAWAIAEAPLHVQTPILVALYTGQRREDVVGMTWQQVQGDQLRVKTSKTRELVDMPCHPALAAHLKRLPKLRGVIPHPTAPICANAAGKPYASANALSGAVRRFVAAHARIPNNRSMHGLRYAAAARMEEGGATVAAIEAVLGHRTFRMALKYASARMRAAQGVAAMKGEA